jgi:hypothetical protein
MGPMSQVELRQAIVNPSQAVGLELEPGLVELLIRGNQSGPLLICGVLVLASAL